MPAGFDLVRRSKAKAEVGCDPSTLDRISREFGLVYYRLRGTVWFSKVELECIIRTHGEKIRLAANTPDK